MVENISIDESYARMTLEAHPGPYILITITDTGTGIAPELLERIFDPFFTTKEVGKGTGLGLSTVLGIVKSHGGFIQVTSEIGKGTQFKVYLPAIEQPEDQPADDSVLPLGQNELILIVEDETSIQQVTKISLETSRYRTLLASDGIEAVALFAEHGNEIDLILIDMMMASMDGLATMQTLQRMNPDVKMIAMSGLVTENLVSSMMKAGAQAFLPKPFTTQELLVTLNQVLHVDHASKAISKPTK
jgi:CheY-like chemotaxis protein